MFIFKNKKIDQGAKLYNKILSLSRNNIFYTKFQLSDSFQNRIILIFFHTAFLLVKFKIMSRDKSYKKFSQDMFDLMFKEIELNMRELGHGDVSVNKNMKYLVKTFYNILLKCENYSELTTKNKKIFLFKYLASNANISDIQDHYLIEYFNQFHAFCFDLDLDSVLRGDLKFNYN